MKRVIALVLLFATLCGCSLSNSGLNKAMELREGVLKAQSCSFQATITADYSEKIYTFVMQCTFDSNADMKFEVRRPDTLSGISGNVSDQGGKLTFDDKALLFEPLIDDMISPVSAPWVFFRALRGGYIKGCATDDAGYYIQIDDSYEDNSLQLDVWADHNVIPLNVEMFWMGRRILSITIENFTLL